MNRGFCLVEKELRGSSKEVAETTGAQGGHPNTPHLL